MLIRNQEIGEIQGEKITKRKVLKFRIEGDIGAENPRKRVF